MKAARVHRFGSPDVIQIDEIDVPVPAAHEVLVRVAVAGVGPWDSWIRAGKSVLPQPLPLTLGSDLSGTVEAVGPGVTDLAVGDPVFGVANKRFTNAYAELAIASTATIARKPASVEDALAASAPVVSVTALQMLFDHGKVGRHLRSRTDDVHRDLLRRRLPRHDLRLTRIRAGRPRRHRDTEGDPSACRSLFPSSTCPGPSACPRARSAWSGIRHSSAHPSRFA